MPVRREAAVLAAAGAVMAVTAAWWTVALWPATDASPEWLTRVRTLCFGRTSTGLPDASGWMMLVLQPALMFGILVATSGRAAARGVAALAKRPAGQATLVLAVAAVTVGAGSAVARVRSARAAQEAATRSPGAEVALGTPADVALREPAPPLGLVNQHGDTVRISQFRGRPVLVSFAFGHCETVCPVVVRDLLTVRRRAAALDPAVVIVTVDPWRDLPSRLPHIGAQWRLGTGEHVLSGPVGTVEAVLDAWGVGRRRNLSTGDVLHPRLVYLVDPQGDVVMGTSAGVVGLLDLLATT